MLFDMGGRNLKQALLVEYGTFADKRTKNVDKGSRFILDDRGTGDFAADKKLYSWFCKIFAEVESEDEAKLLLSGGVPKSAGVMEWINKHGARLQEKRNRPVSTALTKSVKSGGEFQIRIGA